MKICEYVKCRKEFEETREAQRFCNRTCAARAAGSGNLGKRKGQHLSQEWKDNISGSLLGKRHKMTREGSAAIAARMSKYAKEHTGERNKVHKSKSMERMWATNPEKLRRRYGQMTRPEKIVASIVEPLGFSYEARFVRSHGKTLLPDFHKDMMFIEVLGEYWHTQEESDERKSKLEEFGYAVLLIWAAETKDVPTLKEKIERWVSQTTKGS